MSDDVRSKEIVGSDLVAQNLKDYGSYVINKQFPGEIDGLKTVWRRVLWTLYLLFGNKPNQKKSSTILGDVRELHPHGDASMYETVIRMANEYYVDPPIFAVGGNKGSYVTPDHHAASRYTDIKLTQLQIDLFFGDSISSVSIPKVPNGDNFEPKFLVPTVPVSLFVATSTVGYGYGSATVALNFNNVCDLVVAYAEHRSKTKLVKSSSGKLVLETPFPYWDHVDLLIPDFPIDNTLMNYEELKAAYKAGKFDTPIKLDGSVAFSGNQIYVKTLPFGVMVDTVREKVQHDIQKRKGEFIEANIKDVSRPKYVTIDVKDSKDPFVVWDTLKDMIRFSGTVNPNSTYVTDGGSPVKRSYIDLLELWYQQRYNLISASKRDAINRSARLIERVRAELIIVNHADEVYAIIRNNMNEDAREALMKRFGISPYQASIITDAKIVTVSKESAITLNERLASLLDAHERLMLSMQMIHQEIASDAQRMKRIYGRPRHTRIPNYIGYISIGEGCIQVESTDEIIELMDAYPRKTISIHMYDGPHLFKIDRQGRFEKGSSVSKVTCGDIYGLSFSEDRAYTVNINDGAACCVKGIVPGLRADGYLYTTVNSKFLHRSGALSTGKVTDHVALRKSIGRGTNTDIIHVYPAINKDHYLIVSSDGSLNTLRVYRIRQSTPSIAIPPIGTIYVEHHLTGKDWFFSLPASHLNRCGYRAFRINDANKLLGDADVMVIDLNATKTKKMSGFELLP